MRVLRLNFLREDVSSGNVKSPVDLIIASSADYKFLPLIMVKRLVSGWFAISAPGMSI